MSRRFSPRRLALAVALFALAPSRAQLTTVSPFSAPPTSSGSNAPTANAPLEFRGVAELPGGTTFRVVDPARKVGAWARLNEPDPDLGFVVKQHDAAHETVVVEFQGRMLTLPLHQSKVSSGGVPLPNPATLVMPPPPALAATPPAPSALAAQQAQLDAVAAAVAQRRALRDQAQQQIQRGLPVVVPPVQPQGQATRPGKNQNGTAAPATMPGGTNAATGPSAPRVKVKKNQPE